ncbi:hypothetical protein [Microbacterium sp. NPDC080220]|uniref:hypothetical protein n=1 Tax=Microbacterium sp. NPDC080220 TaxID=3161017 RepID=UPI00342C6AB1
MSAPVTPLRAGGSAAPVYLSPEQVCELVPGMTVANLKDLRASGKGPAYFKPTGDRGRVTLYAQHDVVRWIESSRVTTREQR